MSLDSPKTADHYLYPSLAWQLILLICVWAFVVWLHSHNDGLWYQGDAPRHAINGFFWKDLLTDRPTDVKAYAMSYYVRYPTINPVSYPPLFYILTAVSYATWGPSAFAAKGVVLAFALLMAIYGLAWLRRWLGPESGWVAPLVVLAPSVIAWSHAVMLNIPSVACQVAALFHFRVWMDNAPARRRLHLWLSAGLALAATLMHFTGCSVLFVMLAWSLTTPGRPSWGNRRLLITLLVGGGLVLPFGVLFLQYAHQDVEWLLPDLQHLVSPSMWLFYPARLMTAFGIPLCALAVCGLFSICWQSEYRSEQRLMAIWVAVILLVFALVVAKEIRYVLQIVVPLAGLAVIAVERFSVLFQHWTGRTRARTVVVCTSLSLVTLSLVQAYHYHVPNVDGYRALVEYLKKQAPQEAVFYDGFYHGVFAYYLRAQDPRFEQRVVLGQKSLYSYVKMPGWKQQHFVDTEDQVLDTLCEDFGCRWLVVEYGTREGKYGRFELVRSAVESSEVEFQKTFPIKDGRGTSVGVYRINRPVREGRHH